MKLQGRTFVISGGASGLGQACAVDIVGHGGNVAILDLSEENGRALEAKLGPSAKFFAVDVLETDSIAAAVKGAVGWARETGRPLGGVIAAAGIGMPSLILDKHHRTFSLDHVDLVLGINLRGTLDLVRQVLPHLTAPGSSPHPQEKGSPDGERGVVIMVASSAAFEGQMGQVAYAASKGAVAAVTLPMARDLSRHGVRVVTIAPGLFETPMTAVMSDRVRESLRRAMEFPPRAGKPDEFAFTVRHAIENVMLNGTVIRLDGATRMPSRL